MTVEEALAHPTWSMGPKITIDSATLANKGLELIEAHYLFGLDYERIEVVVHPTSVVHALVRFRDGAVARAPRLSGHARPDLVRAHVSRARARRRCPALDFSAGPHARVRAARSRALPAAPRSRARPASAAARIPCAFNAANEVAVAAFLDGRIGFLEIARARRGRARRRRRRAGARPRRARRGRRGGTAPRAGKVGSSVSFFIAILGLALPHPRPRGRALLRVARRRAAAAPLLHRLPARDREDDAQGHRVRRSARSRSAAS